MKRSGQPLEAYMSTINYSKWDNLRSDDDTDDSDREQLRSSKPDSSLISRVKDALEPLQIQKQIADDFFEQAESSNFDKSNYILALDRYDDIIPQLERICNSFSSNSSDPIFLAAKRLELSCNLNISCCFLRLENWPQVLLRVKNAFVTIENKHLRSTLPISDVTILRGRQFRCTACLHIGDMQHLTIAQEESKLIQTSLSSLRTEGDNAAMSGLMGEMASDLDDLGQTVEASMIRLAKKRSPRAPDAGAFDQKNGLDAVVRYVEDGMSRGLDLLQSAGIDLLARECGSHSLAQDGKCKDAIEVFKNTHFKLVASLVQLNAAGDSVPMFIDRAVPLIAAVSKLWRYIISLHAHLNDCSQSASEYINTILSIPFEVVDASRNHTEDSWYYMIATQLLTTATHFYSINCYISSSECYQAAHDLFLQIRKVGDADDSGGSGSASAGDGTMLAAISLAGVGNSLVLQKQYDSAIPRLASALESMESYFAILSGLTMNDLSDFSCVFPYTGSDKKSFSYQQSNRKSLVSITHHLWSTLNSLYKCYEHLEDWSCALHVVEKTVRCCDFSLEMHRGAKEAETSGKECENEIVSPLPSTTPPSTLQAPCTPGQAALLSMRYRRAMALKILGDLVNIKLNIVNSSLIKSLDRGNNDNNGGGNDSTRMNPWAPITIEYTVETWTLAAEEFLAIDKVFEGVMLQVEIGNIWANAAGIGVLDISIYDGQGLGSLDCDSSAADSVNAEKAHVAYRLAGKVSIAHCDKDRKLLSIALMSIIQSALSAMRYDHAASIQELHIATQLIDNLKQEGIGLEDVEMRGVLLPGNVATGSLEAIKADVIYHSAHCSLKLASVTSGSVQALHLDHALANTSEALLLYKSLPNTAPDKMKSVVVLQCLAHVAQGDERASYEDITAYKALCLMPMEDPEKQAAFLLQVVERRFKRAVPPAHMPSPGAPCAPSTSSSALTPEAEPTWKPRSRFKLQLLLKRMFLFAIRDENVGGLVLSAVILAGMVVVVGMYMGDYRYGWVRG